MFHAFADGAFEEALEGGLSSFSNNPSWMAIESVSDLRYAIFGVLAGRDVVKLMLGPPEHDPGEVSWESFEALMDGLVAAITVESPGVLGKILDWSPVARTGLGKLIRFGVDNFPTGKVVELFENAWEQTTSQPE